MIITESGNVHLENIIFITKTEIKGYLTFYFFLFCGGHCELWNLNSGFRKKYDNSKINELQQIMSTECDFM